MVNMRINRSKRRSIMLSPTSLFSPNRLKSNSISQSGPISKLQLTKHISLVKRENSRTESYPRISLENPQNRSIFKFPSHLSLSKTRGASFDLEKLPRSPNLRKPGRRVIISPCNERGTTNWVSKCIYKTKVGSSMGIEKPHNQDSLLISPFLQGQKTQFLFSVFDGHGPDGHEVSSFLKSNLTRSIEDQLKHNGPTPALTKGISLTVKQLAASGIDLAFSGSTLSLIFIKNNVVTSANIGDSRAVIGKRLSNEWVAQELTKDHKPNDPEEKKRILNNRGRVLPIMSENGTPAGPARVWLEREQIPGLAMSRSIGDRVAHSVGVISDPEITTYTLSNEDKFIVLATDGIWEFLSNSEVIKIVGNAVDGGGKEEACYFLVKEAAKRWETQDGNVDDITLVIIFLNSCEAE